MGRAPRRCDSFKNGTHVISASFGKVDITPSTPVTLGGYADRPEKTLDIADRLEANIALLRGGESRVIIVTLDTLYPGEPLRRLLLERLKLREEELFLSASHTHWAPMMAPDMPGLGAPNPEYIAYVAEKLVSLIRDLEGRQADDVTYSYHALQASHAMNRRLVRLRLTRNGLRYGAGMGPNPDGEKDEEVRVLQVCAGGRPVAFMWNYSCHPTGYPIRHEITAEYPGVVRAAIRKRYGDVPVLFFLGFAGDVRPPFHGTPKRSLKGALMRLLWGPQFRSPNLAEWKAWAAGIAGSVLKAIETNVQDITLSAPIARRIPIPAIGLGNGKDGEQALAWHLVDCGTFVLAGINAEPVAAYRRLLLSVIGSPLVFSVGYLDQTYAYLPVDAMLQEGGYEVDGFRPMFGYRAHFASGVSANAVAVLNRGG